MESQSLHVKTMFSQPSSKWVPNLLCESGFCWVGCSAPLWGLTTVCPWPWDIPRRPCSVLWCCREVLSSAVLFPDWCPWPLCHTATAMYEVTFWCIEFLVTVLSSQLHFAVRKSWIVTERCVLIMVYTSFDSTVSPFYPFQSYVSSFFVLLRELPRSWWEASGGCSGWTLIASFLLLLFVTVGFQQGRQRWQGRRQRCHSGCCGAASLAILAIGSSSLLYSQLYSVTMQGSQSSLLVQHLRCFAGGNCSFLGGCRGRKGAAPSRRGCLIAWHLVVNGCLALIWLQMKLELVKP